VRDEDQACIPYSLARPEMLMFVHPPLHRNLFPMQYSLESLLTLVPLHPKVHESKYKALLQASRFNVALHVMVVMHGYCKRQRCGA
jgi:hypothetical protein